jgi:hypothetical protein
LASHVQVAIIFLDMWDNSTPFGSGIDLAVLSELTKKSFKCIPVLSFLTKLSVLCLLLRIVESSLKCLHVRLERSQDVKLSESLVLLVILERLGG